MRVLSWSLNDNYWRSSRGGGVDSAQMELPFNGSQESYTLPALRVYALDEIHGRDLLGELVAYEPMRVIDLREFSQFNLPGISRREVFSTFDRIGASYFEHPMPWSKINTAVLSAVFSPLASKLRNEHVFVGVRPAFFVSNGAQKSFIRQLLS